MKLICSRKISPSKTKNNFVVSALRAFRALANWQELHLCICNTTICRCQTSQQQHKIQHSFGSIAVNKQFQLVCFDVSLSSFSHLFLFFLFTSFTSCNRLVTACTTWALWKITQKQPRISIFGAFAYEIFAQPTHMHMHLHVHVWVVVRVCA